MNALPGVAIFDTHLPTGLAFLRSLGRAGVEVTAYHSSKRAIGRYSRHTTDSKECPDFSDTDSFVAWLAEELRSGRIGLIAPTSDSLVFNTASAIAQLEHPVEVGHPTADALLACLLKQRFADALEGVGFPTPATRTPLSIDEARDFAASVGYPMVAKPRTHVGVGVVRGAIIRNDSDLAAAMIEYDLGDRHQTATAHDPNLAWPLLQQFIDRPNLEVISVTGCIGRDGEVLALDHSSKQRQWPPDLGIGTLFVAPGEQTFTEHAVEAVRAIQGRGIFEFEVLYDRRSGDYWGIDLNPRAFGQVALTIARGNDLPARWYESVTGATLPNQASRRRVPSQWQMGVPLTTDFVVGLLRGPDRLANLAKLPSIFGRSAVGAAFDWSDPVPGLAFGKDFLKHPGGLVRPYLNHSAQKLERD